jgi:hypothetical protein
MDHEENGAAHPPHLDECIPFEFEKNLHRPAAGQEQTMRRVRQARQGWQAEGPCARRRAEGRKAAELIEVVCAQRWHALSAAPLRLGSCRLGSSPGAEHRKVLCEHRRIHNQLQWRHRTATLALNVPGKVLEGHSQRLDGTLRCLAESLRHCLRGVPGAVQCVGRAGRAVFGRAHPRGAVQVPHLLS